MKKMLSLFLVSCGLYGFNYALLHEEAFTDDTAIVSDDVDSDDLLIAGNDEVSENEDVAANQDQVAVDNADDQDDEDEGEVPGATVIENGQQIIVIVTLPGFKIEDMDFSIVPSEENSVKYFVGMERSAMLASGEAAEKKSEEAAIDAQTEVRSAAQPAEERSERPTGFVLTVPQDVKDAQVEKLEGAIKVTFSRGVELEDEAARSATEESASAEAICESCGDAIEQA